MLLPFAEAERLTKTHHGARAPGVASFATKFKQRRKRTWLTRHGVRRMYLRQDG